MIHVFVLAAICVAGRAATPTFLVLDDQYQIRGCWVERPQALKDFLAKAGGDKMKWYEDDAGREIMRELVEMLEAAKTDAPICRANESRPEFE